jgi:hypothetical protein
MDIFLVNAIIHRDSNRKGSKFDSRAGARTEEGGSSTPSLVLELQSEKINWRNTDLWLSRC